MAWYVRGAGQKMQKDKVREPRVCLHGHHSDIPIPAVPWAGQTQGTALPGMNEPHEGGTAGLP